MNILDRPINKSRGVEVGLPAWAFLFSEVVSYSQTRVDSVADLEKRRVIVVVGIVVSGIAVADP